MCVDNIYSVWKDGQADKPTKPSSSATLSTPVRQCLHPERQSSQAGISTARSFTRWKAPLSRMQPEEPAFTIYDDIREKLVARGIPREQIAFIHEANTEARKKEPVRKKCAPVRCVCSWAAPSKWALV